MLASVIIQVDQLSCFHNRTKGGLFYRFYARAQSAKEQQERALVGDAEELGAKTVPRVLVAVGAVEQLPPLLRVAAAVA